MNTFRVSVHPTSKTDPLVGLRARALGEIRTPNNRLLKTAPLPFGLQGQGAWSGPQRPGADTTLQQGGVCCRLEVDSPVDLGPLRGGIGIRTRVPDRSDVRLS